MRQRTKKGSVPVFLTAILLPTILILAFLTEAAAGTAARSYAEGVLFLAGRSILSEYDRYLKEDYGIFGLLCNSEVAEERLRFYIESSFNAEKDGLEFFRLEVRTIRADLGSYALTNPDQLEEQILECMKLYKIPEGFSVLNLAENNPLTEGKKENEEVDVMNSVREERVLKNHRVFDQLPSRTITGARVDSVSIGERFQVTRLFEESKDGILLNLYIQKMFRNQQDSASWKDTFYVNEIEYILFGSTKDETNRVLTAAALTALRTSLNLTYIYADSEKRKAVAAVAAALTPGPEAAATQAALSAAWAAAEAANDVKRLYRGDNVPFYKTAEDWVLDLDLITEAASSKTGNTGNVDGNSFREKKAKGLDYENYLFLLLCLESRENKLLRIMDLIQINMKGNHYSNFLFSECYGGLDYICILERESSYLPVPGQRNGEFRESHVY